MSRSLRVAVVGAGMTGLVAAGRLAAAGHDVVVVDKGRSPGGRLATRRLGAATLDHGAQFFTVRTDELAALVAPLLEEGLVVEWCRGFGAEPDGHPRFAVRGGMNRLAKRLADGLDVRCGVQMGHLGELDVWDGWGEGAQVADAVVLTAPSPQAVALLEASGIEAPAALHDISWHPTLAVLAVLDRSPALPGPGAVQEPGAPFAFAADNQAKGVSAVPAVTLHADAATSSTLWRQDDDAALADLLTAARAAGLLGEAGVVEAQLKRWRYATPDPRPERCLVVDAGGGPWAGRPIVVAGDAFGGPKVEGAALSGLAAADAVLAAAATP